MKPDFSSTRAEPMFSKSHTAPMRNTEGWRNAQTVTSVRTHDRDVLDVVKLALVGEIVLLPGALDDLETLNLAVLAFGIGDVQRLIGLHDAAAPDAED